MSIPTQAHLEQWDAEDPLNWTRAEFEIPSFTGSGGEGKADGEAIYFCGNSLGLLSKKGRKNVIEELDIWSERAVAGHFNHPLHRPWKHVDAPLTPLLANIIGAKESEVAHTSTLTSNLHNLFCSFYRPTKTRWKIVIERGSFPSDWYAIHSHPRLHDDILSEEQIEEAIIPLTPRAGEETLRTEDILKAIGNDGDSIAVVWLPLVQYYSGQLFDVKPIAAKTHDIGAVIGLDMAHGIGNIDCKLNEWEVDFAVWCTYKYLNAGPGAVGGHYIRDGLENGGRRLAGWWGNDAGTRFQMAPTFRPTPGAKGYQHSNPPVLSSMPLLATLELMKKITFPTLRAKAIRLTDTLEKLLRASKFHLSGHADSKSGPFPSATTRGSDDRTIGFRIITPAAPWRGTQLSLFIAHHLPTDGAGKGVMPRVFTRMLKKGLVGDEREPNVIRLSPVALYNTFGEIGRAVRILEESLEEEVKWVAIHGQEGGSEEETGVEHDMIAHDADA